MEVRTRAQRYAEKRNTVSSEIELAKNANQEASSTRMSRRVELRTNEGEVPTVMPNLRTRTRSISFSLDEPIDVRKSEADVKTDLSMNQPDDGLTDLLMDDQTLTSSATVMPITADEIFSNTFDMENLFDAKNEQTSLDEESMPIDTILGDVLEMVEESTVGDVEESLSNEETTVEEAQQEETTSAQDLVQEEYPNEVVEENNEECFVEEQTNSSPKEEFVCDVEEDTTSEMVEPDVDIESDDFLSQLLEEVNAYNVANGERSIMDTTATIISDLKQQNAIDEKEQIVDDVHQLGDVDDLLDLNNSSPKETIIETETVEDDDLYAQVAALMKDQQEEKMDVEEENTEVDVPNEEFFTPTDTTTEDKEEVELTSESIEQGSLDLSSNEEGDEAIQQLTQKLNRERIFREELLQETRQMKLQMDQYENELSSVGKNMDRTNRVLNFILIILIIALFAVLLFIAYWAMVDRGILPAVSLMEQVPVTLAQWGLLL